MLRVRRFLNKVGWSDRVRVEFFDLETAEGLAEAAYQQLDGELPAVLVEAKVPGAAISGETPFRGRIMSLIEGGPDSGRFQSLN